MLLDELMPAYHFRERHAIGVRASREAALAALRSLRPEELRVLTVLMAARNLPSRLRGRRPPSWSSEPLLDQLLARGFVVLAEEPGREIVLGVIGRFWTPDAWASEPEPVLRGAQEFMEFDVAGYAKAAANFRVQGSGPTTVTTETRILATDSVGKRKFALYWALIRPGSGLIRHDLLRAIRRRAS
jgi:hypothetical protein